MHRLQIGQGIHTLPAGYKIYQPLQSKHSRAPGQAPYGWVAHSYNSLKTGEHPPATCVSIIVVLESHLGSPKLVGAEYCKIIMGVFHSLKYERMVSAICVIYGKKFYHSQILGNATSFTTCSGDYSLLFIYVYKLIIYFLGSLYKMADYLLHGQESWSLFWFCNQPWCQQCW